MFVRSILALGLLGCPKSSPQTAPEAPMLAKARPHATRIPRTDLFGNPEVSLVRIAPDGSRVTATYRVPVLSDSEPAIVKQVCQYTLPHK